MGVPARNYAIARLDLPGSGTHGWQVRLQRRGVKHAKYFSDRGHGGRVRAFELARDWRDADMKVGLSQTIFCGGAHIHGKLDGRLHADLDSNGWPQTGRNKAIDALRKCFAASGWRLAPGVNGFHQRR